MVVQQEQKQRFVQVIRIDLGEDSVVTHARYVPVGVVERCSC